MDRIEKFALRDWFVAAAFFAASFAVRLPFRSHLAYHWDSAQYVLAIREYNVALSQPQAPGYFLYVMLGRLVNLFVGDPHRSLIWISLVFGSALCAALYLLGSALFGRRTGVVAALLGMTSPQAWFHSCVAFMNVVDGFLVVVTVLHCWRAMQRGGRWADAVILGVLFALIGGVRQQTVLALWPLALYVFWQFSAPRAWKLLATGITSASLALAWFIPMVRMSGGLPLYLAIVRLRTEFCFHKTPIGGGWDQLVWNLSAAAKIFGDALLLGAGLLAGALVWNAWRLRLGRQWTWGRQNAQAIGILIAWIASMLPPLVVGFVDVPGHLFCYLPPWVLLVAVVVVHFRKKWIVVAATLALCVANTLAFVAGPRSLDRVFEPMARSGPDIQRHDKQLSQIVRLVRSHYRPGDTILCYAREYFSLGFRHLQLYLPEFDHYQLVRDPTLVNPDDKPLWRARGGRLEFVSRLELGGKKTLLLVVPPRFDASLFRPDLDVSHARSVPGSSGILYELSVGSVAEDKKM